MRILVVDDSNTMRTLVIRNLKANGFTDVVECESGAKALEILNDSPYDLVLLDWHMPDMDGLEVLRRIRAGSHAGTPVIMLTMEQKRKNIEYAIKSGANDYVLKPLNPKVLRDKIERLRRASIVQEQLNESGTAARPTKGPSAFAQSNPLNSAPSSSTGGAEEAG